MSQNVVVSTTLDDTSSNVTYAGTGWTYHTNQDSIFHLYNASDTFSADQGATATLRFYGTAIDYWGNQGPYHGPCKITLDGSDVATVNSNAAADDFPILLYSNNNLQLGDHTLVITVVDSAYPSVCEVDRFVVNVTSSVTYTSAYAYTGPGSTPTGGSLPSGSIADNGNGGNGSNNNNGNKNKSSSPPVAAIAGAVGGVAAIAILILVWWWYRRSQRNKPNTMAALKKQNTEQIKPFLADGAMVSPSTLEKSIFDSGNVTRQPYPNQPSSYVSSSPPPSTYPPSSPPPSTVGYNNYPFVTASAVPPTSVGHQSPPGSPQPNMRPMSTISAAPSASYYSSAPVTVEGGGYTVPSQPIPTSTIAPVWAMPAAGPTTGYQPVPTEPSPSPSPAPLPVVAPIVATDAGRAMGEAGAYDESRRPEKARYTGSQAPPEKARYTGTSSAGQSSGGASSSAGPTVSTTVPAASESGQPSRNDTMSPVTPEAPPPAYQI